MKTLLLTLMVFGFSFSCSAKIAQPHQAIIDDEQAWIQYNIMYYCELYDVDVGLAMMIAKHESFFRNVPNSQGSSAFGPFQQIRGFWSRYAAIRDMDTNPEHRKSIEANVEMAIWVLANYGTGDWNESKSGWGQYLAVL